MELYILRHGIAVPHGARGYEDDTKRPLTSEGRRKLRRIARSMRRMELSFDLILSSPYVRARQTAEIVAGGLAPRPSLVNIDALAPDSGYAALITELEKHARKPRIALVGHEPDIGELGARLVGSRRSIEFKKGAICRIDVDEIPPNGPGQLCWFLTPKILLSLKK